MKSSTEKKIVLNHSELKAIVCAYIRKNNVWLPENPNINFGTTSHNANWAEVTFLEEDESEEEQEDINK